MSEKEIPLKKIKSEEATHRHRKPNEIVIPRRTPSVVIPERKPIYITADKLTCAECTCFPKEDPYEKPKKLNPCQKSPLTLYELAAYVVDRLKFPEAFNWTEKEVAEWIENEVGLPEYKESIFDNYINGRRLLMLEDPSHLPEINIRNFEHIKMITAKVHQLFSTEFIKFSRSIGLPPRKPLTHCTWFKSRTGPDWGIRENWTRGDILRWMKIIMPEPLHLDHWDLVWYQKPDFPKVMFARIPKATPSGYIPRYKHKKHVCREYLTPRRFLISPRIRESRNWIWMEHTPVPKEPRKKVKEVKIEKPPRKSQLMQKKINLDGLKGKDLILARRKIPKSKFLL